MPRYPIRSLFHAALFLRVLKNVCTQLKSTLFFFPPARRRSLTIAAFIVIPPASVAYLADFILISAHWLLWHFVTGSQIFAYTIGGQLCVCSLCYSKHDILIKGLVGLLNSDRWNLNSISIL